MHGLGFRWLNDKQVVGLATILLWLSYPLLVYAGYQEGFANLMGDPLVIWGCGLVPASFFTVAGLKHMSVERVSMKNRFLISPLVFGGVFIYWTLLAPTALVVLYLMPADPTPPKPTWRHLAACSLRRMADRIDNQMQNLVPRLLRPAFSI